MASLAPQLLTDRRSHGHLPGGSTSLSKGLEAEIQIDDDEVVTYAGDDPHDLTFHKETRRHTGAQHDGKSTPGSTVVQDDDAKDPELVQWDGPNDPENPQNYRLPKKIAVTVMITLLTAYSTFSSSAPSTAIQAISKEFGSSEEVGLLITSLFLIGFVCGPIIWSGLSEMFGRRIVFMFTALANTLFLLGQALAHNMTTLLVTRFLCGVFTSAALSNGGGMLADIWGPIGRGHAATLFISSVFSGPALGPIISAFILTSHLGWRWIFWLLMIIGGACWVLTVVFLPETYSPVLLQAKARRLRKSSPAFAHVYADLERQDRSISGLLQRTILRPFIMLVKEPILALVAIYLSLLYGLIYGTLEVFPIVFVEIRGFPLNISGLPFIGMVVGVYFGACITTWEVMKLRPLIIKWRGHPPVEERLRGAMIGGPLLVIAIFWLGWAGAYKSVPWYVVELSIIPFGMSVSLLFISFLSYIVESYLMFSASALAGNAMIRSALAASFPLYTNQMFHNLGVQWAATLLGCIALILAPMPFIFFKYGARVRRRSTIAPCLDLKIKDEMEQYERDNRKGENNDIV